jgi:hypothetical protein
LTKNRLRKAVEAIPSENANLDKLKVSMRYLFSIESFDEKLVEIAESFVKQASPFQLPVVTRLLRFLKTNTERDSDDTALFARFCTESAVIDQRVAELQLMRCNHVNFRECVGKMFGAGERVRQVLFEPSGAVKRKLVSLLTDPTIDADRFAQHVRLAQLVESDGVDEQTWSIVAVFFASLAHARRCEPTSTVNESFLIPWIGADMSLKQPLFTLDQQAVLEKLYASESAHIALASVCKATGGDGVHRPPSVVARDAGGVPHFVAESDATNVQENRRRLVFMSRCIADLRNSNVFSNSFALQCAGLKVELTMMLPMCESLFVNLLLADLDFGACSMSDAIDCVSLLIGIHTGDVSTVNARIGEALFGGGVREEVDAVLGELITKGKAPPPPLPSNVSRPPSSVRLTFDARLDLSDGYPLISCLGERFVVNRVQKYAGFVFKVLDVSECNKRIAAITELRIHEMLTRLAPQFVVPLLKHFEGNVSLPSMCRVPNPEFFESIVLVMEDVWPVELARPWTCDLQMGSALLGALVALHDLRVAHNDLTWQNVLRVGAEKRWVLCDFGLAHVVDLEGCAPMRRGIGTREYMAPEVVAGSAMCMTTSVDVFAAGVCLRELWGALGEQPFEQMDELVKWMCALKPNDRPSARMALQQWERVLAAKKVRDEQKETTASTTITKEAVVVVVEEEAKKSSESEREGSGGDRKRHRSAVAATSEKMLEKEQDQDQDQDQDQEKEKEKEKLNVNDVVE